jgi:glycosyltransferase involved in cell wall biosynthesis
MKVLGLASYPVEAAATRYRLAQFVGPLADRGITLTIRPFLDSKLFARLYRPGGVPGKAVTLAMSALRRMKDLLLLNQAEVVLIQREAMILGPPLVEWLAVRVLRRPMVLDLDDATYVSYTSPTYGRLGKTLKWFSKTDDLIRWASIVTCGNRAIAEYAESKGATTCIIPTVVDAEVFRPAPDAARSPTEPLVLGWIGTHSTFPYLEAIFPVLQKLAGAHHFKLRIVGAGKEAVEVPGVEVETLKWKLEREVADFQSFDIGLYPIDPTLYAEKWAAGKSGFKAIQYMAVGIPFVAAPVGAMAEIGKPGATHLHAVTNDEWREALASLLSSERLREKMGAAGREHVLEYYSLGDQAEKLAEALRQAAGNKATSKQI